MGNLLFSPSGRVGPSEFMRGAMILIAINFVIGVLPLINYTIGSMFSLLGLILIWCWIALFIKRYHDGGKSGWMSLVPIIAFVILSLILSQIVTSMFAGNINAQLKEATEAAAESGDISSIFAITTELAPAIAKKTALPSAIGGAIVSYLIAMVFNNMIKSDDHENQFGPAT